MYRNISSKQLPRFQQVDGVIADAVTKCLVAAADKLHRQHPLQFDRAAHRLSVVQQWYQVAEHPSKPTRLLLRVRLNNGSRYGAAWLWRAHEDQLAGFWERVPYEKVVSSVQRKGVG